MTFPTATVILCQFHALKAVQERISRCLGLSQNDKRVIYEKWHKAVYATCPTDFEEAKIFVTSNGQFVFVPF